MGFSKIVTSKIVTTLLQPSVQIVATSTLSEVCTEYKVLHEDFKQNNYCLYLENVPMPGVVLPPNTLLYHCPLHNSLTCHYCQLVSLLTENNNITQYTKHLIWPLHFIMSIDSNGEITHGGLVDPLDHVIRQGSKWYISVRPWYTMITPFKVPVQCTS